MVLNYTILGKQYLLQALFTVWIVAATSGVSASEFLKTYGTDYKQNSDVAPVYKFVDANGKVTYSSLIQRDFVDVEEMSIATPPSDEYANETRLRSEKLKVVAEELGEAREKREKNRWEKEKQRLERLALINQSRPPAYERRRYSGYPYLSLGGYHHGGYRPGKPVHLPATYHGSSPASSSSSFLPRLQR